MEKTEYQVIEKALAIKPGDPPLLLHFNLHPDRGLFYGEEMKIYLERLDAGTRLFIYGAGHVGKATARLASSSTSKYS